MFEGSRLGIQVSSPVSRHYLLLTYSLVGQEPSVLRVAHR